MKLKRSFVEFVPKKSSKQHVQIDSSLRIVIKEIDLSVKNLIAADLNFLLLERIPIIFAV